MQGFIGNWLGAETTEHLELEGRREIKEKRGCQNKWRMIRNISFQ